MVQVATVIYSKYWVRTEIHLNLLNMHMYRTLLPPPPVRGDKSCVTSQSQQQCHEPCCCRSRDACALGLWLPYRRH